MSITDISTETAPGVETAPAPPSAPQPVSGRRAAGAMWARVVLACAVILASGAVRWWQARRIGASMEVGKTSPFPLAELPADLGEWQGEPATPDDEVVRATGATDHRLLRFINRSTGVVVEAYVLYGPAVDLFQHSPEVCYPAAGYTLREGSADRAVECGSGRAQFRSQVFARGEGGQSDLQEVYYSWRFSGRWSPDPGKFKQLERVPGMYKVQLARRVIGHERRDVANPCEALLERLLPEIENRLKAPAISP